MFSLPNIPIQFQFHIYMKQRLQVIKAFQSDGNERQRTKVIGGCFSLETDIIIITG